MHDPIIITNDSELAAMANRGNGTAIDPYVIADWTIMGSTTHGIFITGTTKHYRVENCWIESSVGYGIYVDSVASGTTTIINNTCNDNGGHGISFWGSGFSTVVKNTCNDNSGIGICFFDSSSSTVTHNTCKNNGWIGIYLEGSGFSTVAHNTCNRNYFGIRLWNSDSSTVTNNTCNSNPWGGISLEGSDNNSIVWNTLVGNGAYGIRLSDNSDNNVINHNNFIANGPNTSQAFDDGTNNQWYDETALDGNYWSDYSGDGSYLIDGSAGASDPYPSLSSYRYTSETSFPHVLFRIGLFLIVIGLLVVVLFVYRHQKSS